MKWLVWWVVMVMAFDARATEPEPDITRVTCLQLNREVKDHIRRGADIPLEQLTLFKLVRYRMIDGYEAGRYSRDQLTTGLFELSREVDNVTRTCKRKISRRFVDMLPESVRTLLMTSAVPHE
mgnify:CR=1 FL=1